MTTLWQSYCLIYTLNHWIGIFLEYKANELLHLVRNLKLRFKLSFLLLLCYTFLLHCCEIPNTFLKRKIELPLLCLCPKHIHRLPLKNPVLHTGKEFNRARHMVGLERNRTHFLFPMTIRNDFLTILVL